MEKNQDSFFRFPPATRTDWEKTAHEELNGENPWERLKKNAYGIDVLPFYDSGSKPSLLQPSGNEYLGARTWYNCPIIPALDPASANAMALEHLQNGADGVLFSISGPVDPETLCKNISTPDCSVNFLSLDQHPQQVTVLSQWAANFPNSLPGAVYDAPANNSANTGFLRLSGQTLDSGADFTVNASNWLSNAPANAAVRVFLHEDFLMSICILRALRLAWNRKNPGHSLWIHAISKGWSPAPFEPHGNMLKATTASIAAVLGGCDALTVESAGEPAGLTARIARNITPMLREESHLSKVADPVAGSFFIDQFTTQLADRIQQNNSR